MNHITLLRVAMQLAYAAWGREPTAEAYVAYVALRNELLAELERV